jgi:hypothetical protein
VRGSRAFQLALGAFVLLLVAGCGNPQAEAINKAAICDARTAVVAAVGDVERAVNAAIAGDSQTARDKAGAAASRIKVADQLLKGLPADAQPADARVALLDGGIHLGKAVAAVAAAPDTDAYSPATASQELTSVRESLAKSAAACTAK